MASKARNNGRKGGGGRSRSRPAAQSLPQLLEQLRSEIRAIGERLVAAERRQDETLAALGLATDALHSRDDETQAAIYGLQAAVEPLQLAATGTASAEEIAKHAEYVKLVAGVRRAVRGCVPRGARVLVIGRGDEHLLQLFGRRAGQFPQDAHGDFSGEYPADGTAAVAALESLAAAGWDHLVIPATSLWWLDHYREFRIHLHRSWHAVHRKPHTCAIFALDPTRPGPWRECDDFVDGFRRKESRSPAMLDWETGSDLAGFFPGCAVFPPVDRGVDALPYLERSIDLVAVPWGDAARRSEARRIASAAVIEIALPGIVAPGFRIAVERVGRHSTTADQATSHLGLITPAPRP